MARTNNLTNFLTDVATAIKSKLGDSTSIPAAQFDTKISEIETGGNYQAKSITITTNGNYALSPDTGYDAMNSVSISVNVPSQQPSLQTKSIVENGIYVPDTGYDGFSQVDVNVSDGIKLYNTEQELLNATNMVPNDIMVVFNEDVRLYRIVSSSRSVDLANSVTFSSIPNNVYYTKTTSTTAVRPRGAYTLTITLTNSNLIINLDWYLNTTSNNRYYHYTWDSSDGLTYTFRNCQYKTSAASGGTGSTTNIADVPLTLVSELSIDIASKWDTLLPIHPFFTHNVLSVGPYYRYIGTGGYQASSPYTIYQRDWTKFSGGMISNLAYYYTTNLCPLAEIETACRTCGISSSHVGIYYNKDYIFLQPGTGTTLAYFGYSKYSNLMQAIFSESQSSGTLYKYNRTTHTFQSVVLNTYTDIFGMFSPMSPSPMYRITDFTFDNESDCFVIGWSNNSIAAIYSSTLKIVNQMGSSSIPILIDVPLTESFTKSKIDLGLNTELNKILEDYQVLTDNGVVYGTMTNNGQLSYTPSASQQIIPAGYTSGGTIGAVTSAIDQNIQAENIKSGVTILGVEGTYTGSGTQDTSIIIDSCGLDGSGEQDYENDIFLGGYPISTGATLTNVRVYNSNSFTDISDFVQKEPIITSKSSDLSGMYAFANIAINGNEVRFIPGNAFNTLPVDSWFVLKVRCTDAYGNTLDTNEITVTNSEAPWNSYEEGAGEEG